MFPYDFRQYPPVDPTLFSQSATTAQLLMKDASSILSKFSQSKSFAMTIMSLAQQGKTKQVQQMVQSLGIRSKVDIYFNPDGIRLTLSPSSAGGCCQLVIGLRWNIF
ncbi:hypothetical protein [Anoxybacteroides amylolyticum]|uniref:Putative yuzC protein n=1 Tax=Anoxybacteroides amylolyticum TaxID=294699 RepID=A0A160F6B4_9BACL|nr:hypothetical protein [Anoxybacillus amylolyticus]ANB61363.1 putative yuzC protein [Anoxybacillus amylolyticus]